MNVKRRIKLGEELVQHGAITEEQLQAALAQQKRTGRKLGRVLADLGFMSEASLHEFLSKHRALARLPRAAPRHGGSVRPARLRRAAGKAQAALPPRARRRSRPAQD